MRIIGDVLKTSGVCQDSWHDFLPMIQLSMNNAFNRNMNETPFFAHFGADPRLPHDIVSPQPILLNKNVLGTDSVHESGVLLQFRMLQNP